MTYTPKQCMTRWLSAKADECRSNMKSQFGFDMLRLDAQRQAQNAFNHLDNIGMIEALDFGRVLLEADALS